MSGGGLSGPLAGVRVLALEQMQALPFATQLLTRLGADVVKIEAPGHGDSGRTSLPAMTDPEGRRIGATFLRNNLNKRSLSVDLKQSEGVELVKALAPRFDVFAENFRSGAVAKLGLGYDAIAAVAPRCVYLSVSGFGNTTEGPYRSWPAFAPIVEAMSGIYEMKRQDDRPPVVSPVGGLGDISAALFGVVGVLAALRQRDEIGRGQYVDVAMFDSVVAMTDIVTNFWSMGLRNGETGPMINDGFRAADGWFIMQVAREHLFAKLIAVIGKPEWADDPRFATRQGWVDHLESDIRPAVEAWASTRTRLEACHELGEAGLAAGPCFRDEEVAHDPQLESRDMLVGMERPDGVEEPVMLPGNPIKFDGTSGSKEHRVPWLGEHTDSVLREELGLDADQVASLHERGVVF